METVKNDLICAYGIGGGECSRRPVYCPGIRLSLNNLLT